MVAEEFDANRDDAVLLRVVVDVEMKLKILVRTAADRDLS